MIKLMDILKEISSNNTTYVNADGGEPDTGYTAVGQDRVLGVDVGKPEPWFLKGGYSQLNYPTADDPYGGNKEKKVQQVQVIKRIINTGEKYEGLNQDVASWDKYGSKDYSVDFSEDDLDYTK